MDYNKIVAKYAEEILEVALQHNKLDSFLSGEPPLNIDALNEKNEKINNHMLVMKTIYRKHMKDPSLNLDKQVYEAMLSVLRNREHEYLILNIVKDIEYQLFIEKKGIAPFKLECSSLLKEAKKNIKRNKNKYTSNIFDDHDEYLSTYGHKIL